MGRIRKPRRPAGVILWEGASAIDGAPLVVVAVFESENSKTGNMIQSFILRSDIAPNEAVKVGQDRSICGDCPHRGFGDGTGRSCYVNIGNSPRSVWESYRKGNYPRYDRDAHSQWFAGREFRLGAYGDPSAAPFPMWEGFVREVTGHTGYTHQWRTLDARFSGICMASCDSPQDRLDAIAMGWRTFRVKSKGDPLMPGEFMCPASEEAGKKMQCIDCMACSGTRLGRLSPKAGGVVIDVHGTKVHIANHRRRVALTIGGK